jgi:4-amino-4-deoxy-L-arabinose transferase-like glycosyltransferase
MSDHVVPTAAWICALVAWLNATSWAFITPPFQVTDEPAHFAYVKQVAETGTLPSPLGHFSEEEEIALEVLRFEQIRQNPETPAIFSQAQQSALTRDLRAAARIPERGSSGAAVATSEPPLYYALESIPYDLASGGTLLDRLELMRLLSALMAGFTALFTFMFLRQALPGVRWGWTVGALGVALSPLLGFTSGAVTPDAMLFAVSAALFYCVARAFRQGLSAKSAVAFGVVIAVGFLTKLNFVGLAPGAFLALAILAVRGARRSGWRAIGAPAIAAAIGGMPIAALLSRQATNGALSSSPAGAHGSILTVANYIWQLYLPRLPGTPNDFPGLFTTRQIWFDGYIGRLGWLDTFFPAWVYTAALAIAVVLACLCVRALIGARGSLWGRTPELAVYAVMTVGLLALVGDASYQWFPSQVADFGQARYLLPLLPLLGAALALAARGAGSRWARPVGALIVLLVLAHDLFSQLQVVARYYG